MSSIKIKFCDFWSGFDPEENFFTSFLRKHYDFILVDDTPDYVIYSNFGKEYRKHDCIRIFFTGENARPNFKQADFALSFDYNDNKRHLRFPLYLLTYSEYVDVGINLRIPPTEGLDSIINDKTEFCSFLVSNPHAKFRNQFYGLLSDYKRINSGGDFMNNMNSVVDRSLKEMHGFLYRHKFHICFENHSHPGYTTEKILHAMMADCVPVYWGDPLVGRDFNPKSFINVNDFKTVEEAIDHIIEVDNNDDLYYSYLKEPYIKTDPESFSKQIELKNFFDEIFFGNKERRPVASHYFHNSYNFLHDLYKSCTRKVRSVLNKPFKW